MYCFNNPVSFNDHCGNWPQWAEDFYNSARVTASEGLEKLKKLAYSAYYEATKWHFEDRLAANGEHPTFEEVTADPGWRKLSPDESIFHQDGIGKEELKFIHTDGREAVFNGDTLEPITDPRYMATANYFVLYEISDTPNGYDYAYFAFTYVMHGVVDVAPYLITGKSNTREQFEAKVIELFE